MTEHKLHVVSTRRKPKPKGSATHENISNSKTIDHAADPVTATDESTSLNLLKSVFSSEYCITRQGVSPTPIGSSPTETIESTRKLYESSPEKDINRDNVWAGELDDCYFLASLDVVAAQRPDLIKKMITEHDVKNSDGTVAISYNVTLPGDKTNRDEHNKKPHAVVVYPPAPVDLIVNAQYGGGTWANRIEAANRALTHKYANSEGGGWIPEKGGSTKDALELLTGRKVIQANLDSRDHICFDGKPTENGIDGKLVSTDWNQILGQVMAEKQMMVASCVKKCPVPNGSYPPIELSDLHSYPVLGYDKVHKVVRLREIRKVYAPDKAKTGEFCMPLKDFIAHFDYVTWTNNESDK